MREAKLRSSWAAPDAGYEAACRGLLDGCLDPARSPAFLRDIAGFVEWIAPAGALNSLVQTLLRCTAPGVPDLYQGAEGWDLSLVDPDNRRPVDFAARREGLQNDDDMPARLSDWRTGAVKQALIRKALAARASRPQAFAGGYQPLAVTGERADQVFAFARRFEGGAFIVVAPIRCAAAACEAGRPLIPPDWWGDTALALPADLHGGEALDRLDDRPRPGESWRLADLLADFPVALIEVHTPQAT